MKTVANKLLRLGAVVLNIISYNPFDKSLDVNSVWRTAITAPSNSVFPPVLIVIGLKAFHNIFSQILAQINSEIPDPIP